MTAVAGVVDHGKVYIGADSAATDWTLRQTIKAEAKVFHNGPVLLGVCGSIRMSNLLMHTLCVPGHDKDTRGDHEWMCTAFIDSVRITLENGGCLFKKNGVESIPGAFLAGYRGHLYVVEEDLQVHSARDEYNAVGCGGDHAIGSLFSTKTRKPRERVKLALDAACHHSGGCRPPYVIEVLDD